MYKFLVSIIFIFFAQSALATTYEAELAKYEAYEYESLDYRFKVKSLENSETWCYEYNAVKRCVPVDTQISVLHDLNFIINEKYKADVQYDDLKKNIACKQDKVEASRLNEYRPFDLRLRFFCIEENNIIAYTFQYFPAIKGVGLEKLYYATCSSKDFDEYKLPLLRKFNSFAQSQKPKIDRTELRLDSPLSGEFLIARLSSTKNSAITCNGDSALSITIALNEYKQLQLQSNSQPNKGWYNSKYDLYQTRIDRLMVDLAKQNKPKF